MPGRMFLVDTVQGRIIDDEEVKAEIVSRKPYRSWVTQYRISLDELPDPQQCAAAGSSHDFASASRPSATPSKS